MTRVQLSVGSEIEVDKPRQELRHALATHDRFVTITDKKKGTQYDVNPQHVVYVRD